MVMASKRCRRISLPACASLADAFVLSVFWEASPRMRVLIAGEQYARACAKVARLKRRPAEAEYLETRGDYLREAIKKESRPDITPELTEE